MARKFTNEAGHPPVATDSEVRKVAYAIFQAAKLKGDEMESPTDCAEAALRAMGYRIEKSDR